MTTQPDDDSLGPEDTPVASRPATRSSSCDEAATFVRKSVGTMRYYRHLGIGPRSFRHGRNVAYWQTEILWLAEQAAQPRAVQTAPTRSPVHRSADRAARSSEPGGTMRTTPDPARPRR